MGKFYRKINVVIAPSHFETFGNVAMEAIAVGTPALVSKRMGVYEVFTRLGLDDLILDFNDIEGVIRRIDEIIQNNATIPPKIRKLIAELIAEFYSWDTVVKRYLEICAQQAVRYSPSTFSNAAATPAIDTY